MRKIAILAVGFAPNQSEITETISLLISLSEFKAQFKIFAFDRSTPLNHHELYDLESLNPKDFDALVLPGGIGNATHLSTWSNDKIKMTVNPTVEKIIKQFYEESKPIGAICMAPIVVAKVLAKHNPNITLGENFSETHLVEGWKVTVEKCPSTDYITCRDTKVITTPAYMNDATPFQVFTGIRGLTKELVEMA
ncbi:isoprenoid biosynthesis protein ElbB [Bdellovibrio sp. qaytius]|nr:isoprenoid biosynthesis protein ElbB [Bdellovibrio sp. qaytius]